MIGAEASIIPNVGGEFTAWDGYISGKNLMLKPGWKIIQSWRTTEFGAEDPDSTVKISTKAHEDGTLLTIHHSNLSDDGEHYIKGWEDYYFEPKAEYFIG